MESEINPNNELENAVNKLPTTEQLPSDGESDEMIDGMLQHFSSPQERAAFFEERNNRDNK